MLISDLPARVDGLPVRLLGRRGREQPRGDQQDGERRTAPAVAKSLSAFGVLHPSSSPASHVTVDCERLQYSTALAGRRGVVNSLWQSLTEL